MVQTNIQPASPASPVIVPAEEKQEFVRSVPSDRLRINKEDVVEVREDGSTDVKQLVGQEVIDKSLQSQEQSLSIKTIDDVYNQLSSGNNVTFDKGEGNVQTYTPDDLFFQGDEGFESALQFNIDFYGSQGMPLDTMYAFKEGADWLTDGKQRELAEIFRLSRKNMDDILKPVLADRDIRQIFIDELPTGTFLNNVGNRYKLLEEGLFDLTSYAFTAPVIAAQAYAQAARKGALGEGGFVEEFKLRTGRFGEYRDTVKNWINENTTNGTFAQVGTAEYINAQIHEALERRRDNGNISEDMYNRLAFDTVGNEKLKKEFVDTSTAGKLIDLAFSELPPSLQFGVIALENTPFSGLFSAGKIGKANRFIQAFKAAKKANPKIAEGRTPEAAYKTFVTRGLMEEFDSKIVDLGMFRMRTRAQREKLKTQYTEAQKKMNDMLDNPESYDVVSYNEARQDYLNARRLWLRSTIRDEISPVVSPGLIEVGAISAAQLSGRYLFELAGLPPEVGEGVGALGGVGAIAFGVDNLFLSGVKTTATGLGFAGEKALNLIPAAETGSRLFYPLSAVNWMLAKTADGVNAVLLRPDSIRSYEKSTFIPLYGRPMTMAERGQINQIFKFYGSLDPTEKRQMEAGLEYTNSVYERFINAFPKDSANFEEARDLFLPSFSQATMMPALAGLRMDALNSITVNGRGSTKFARDVMTLNARMTEDSERVRVALSNFEENFLPTASKEHRASLKKMISEARSILDATEDGIKESNIVLTKRLDAFERVVGRTLGSDLDPDHLDNIIALRTELKEKELGRILTLDEQRTLHDEIDARYFDAMNERIDNVAELRNKKAIQAKEMATLTEDLLMAQMSMATRKADKAYSEVRKHGGSVDISPAVDEMLDIAQINKSGDNIMLMFGSEGILFNSIVGRKSRAVFDQMISNSLKRIDPDAKQYYEQVLIDNEILDADTIRDLRKTREGRVQLGLIMHYSIEDVNIFNGVSLMEAENLRRAFADAGYSSKTPGIGQAYKKFVENFDKMLADQDEIGYDKLAMARRTYQDEIGDTMREGTTFALLNKSQNPTERISKDANDPYRFFYKTISPAEMFDSVADKADKLMRSVGKDISRTQSKDIMEFRDSVSDIVRMFADRIVDPSTGRLEVGFDLRTKAGLKKLGTLQRLIGDAIYQRWSADVIKLRVGGVRNAKTDTNLFVESERLKLIDDNMMISVIPFEQTFMQDARNKSKLLLPGKINPQIETRPLVSLENIYHTENDIVELIRVGKITDEQFNNFKSGLASEMKAIKSSAELSSEIDLRSIRLLDTVTRNKKAGDFIDTFIIDQVDGRGSSTIPELREQFIRARKNIDPNVDDADSIKMFDEYMQGIITQGLLEKGGLRRDNTVSLRAISTDKSKIDDMDINFNRQSFQDIGGMLEILTDKGYREALAEVFDDEHLTYLTDMAILMQDKAATAVGVKGLPRGVSLESLISYAYNWNRGMVGAPFLFTSVGLRLIQQKNSTAMLLAFQNKDAARLMRNMIKAPDLVKPQDWRTYEIYMKEFLAAELVKLGYEDLESALGEERAEVVTEAVAGATEATATGAERTVGFIGSAIEKGRDFAVEQLSDIFEQTIDSEGIYDEGKEDER